MRKTALLAAAVAASILIGIGAWIGVKTLTPTNAVAGSTDNAPTKMIGAKGSATWPYDDNDIVVH